MKETAALLLLSAACALGQLRTNVSASFDYPPSACSTTITFHWFYSDSLSVPQTNWPHLSHEQCQVGKTNYSVQLAVMPGSVWVTAVASNLTGVAPFPGAAEVPPQLRSDTILRVR